MAIDVCLAGATGWAGSELARAVAGLDDIALTSAVSRSHAGRSLGDVLGEPRLTCPVVGSAKDALTRSCDVFFEYTRPESARAHVLAAVERGVPVVIGTSGLTESDYAEIARAAEAHGVGVLAVGNFALTAVLLQRFAADAARLVDQWEILDYASDGKADAPSGTARELAHRLAAVRAPEPTVPVEDTVGEREARGATLSGTQVHSIRVPGYVIGVEVIFGADDQRLSLRHDAGSSARPYVEGALMAIRGVGALRGLHRGLDAVLDL